MNWTTGEQHREDQTDARDEASEGHMVNGVECRCQIQQAQSRDLAAVNSQ